MARKLPKIITQEEFERVFKAEKRKRFKLAYLLGFEAGMRISEIIGYKDIPPLMPENVDLERHTIRIISGKGKKDRIVPLPKRINKNAVALLPLTMPRRTLQNAFSTLTNRILSRNLSFHTLRHGFASHLAEKGISLHEIQMLMGHSRLDTTGIYLHTNPKKAIEEARDVF